MIWILCWHGGNTNTVARDILTSVFSVWLMLISPVHVEMQDALSSQAQGCRHCLVCFSFSSYQDERADVWYVAVMDHRTNVRPPARYDETSFAGLPQLGPEGCGPDEEGSRADKHRRPAEDGD